MSRIVEIAVDRLDQLRVGSRRVVDTTDGPVLVIVDDDGAHAIANVCPHHDAALDRGRYSHGLIACPWHHWLIDVRTGACMGIAKAVRTYETIERNGTLAVIVD